MKKLLLLPTLLLALNLGAATTEKTEVAQTKIEKKEPSFLARRADKLKKSSHITDVALIINIISILTCVYIRDSIPKARGNSGVVLPKKAADYKNQSILNITSQAILPLCCMALGTAIGKLIVDPFTRKAMSEKHNFDLEALNQELAAQQAKTNAA